METALLGNEIGTTNAALIVDQFEVFNDYDLDVMKLQSDIFYDPVWFALNSTYNYQPPKDVHDFLLQDLSEVLENLQSKGKVHTLGLKRLVQPKPNLSKNYRQQLVMKLLKLGAEDQEPLSLLALGDIYQAGKFGEKDSKKAYEQYSNILTSEKSYFSKNVLSQTFYNLGHMNHKGIGTQKNLTKAIEYYNMSNKFTKGGSYWTKFSKKLAEWEMDFVGENLTRALGDGQELQWSFKNFMKISLESFEQNYGKKIVIGLLFLGAMILFLAKLRLKNYLVLNLTDANSKKL